MEKNKFILFLSMWVFLLIFSVNSNNVDASSINNNQDTVRVSEVENKAKNNRNMKGVIILCFAVIIVILGVGGSVMYADYFDAPSASGQ